MTLKSTEDRVFFITGNKPFSVYFLNTDDKSEVLFLYTKSKEEHEILMKFFLCRGYEAEELPMFRTEGIEETRKDRILFFPETVEVFELYSYFYWCFMLKVNNVNKINEEIFQLSKLNFKRMININAKAAVVI